MKKNDVSAESGKLDQEFVSGVAWTAAAKWVSQLVSWPSIIIAARVLSPSDFGMVDMAGFYFTLTNVLAEFGIGTAIMQMRELEDKTIRQMHTISLLFGMLACGLTIAVAPLIAEFFHTPPLTLLMRVCSVTFIMVGLQAVPQGLLQKEMEYRKISLTEAIQAIVQAVLIVSGALGGLGYWTLPIANLAGRGVSLGLTLYWAPISFGCPRGSTILKPIKFGTEIAFQRMAWMFYLQSDGIVIGRLMGQAALGTYRLAINLASAPAEKVGMLIMRVTWPLFARVQNDLALMRRYFLILTEILTLTLLPLVAGMIILAPDFVRIILGPNWDGAIEPLQWLAVFTVVRTLNSLSGQVLTALRLMRFNSWMVTVNVIVMPIAFLIAARWGTGAVAATWFIMSPITNLPSLLRVLKAIECGKRKYLAALLPAMISCGAMTGVLVAVKVWWMWQWAPLPRLVVAIPLGGAVYIGVLAVFFRTRVLHYIRFLRNMRKSRATASELPDAPVIDSMI